VAPTATLTYFFVHPFLEFRALIGDKASVAFQIDKGLYALLGDAFTLTGQVPHFVVRSEPDVQFE